MKLQEVFNQVSAKYFFIYILFGPLAFILTAYGLYIVDKSYGYHAYFNYSGGGVKCDSVSRLRPSNQAYLIKQKFPSEIKSGVDFPEKEKYLTMVSKAKKEDIAYGAFCLGLMLSLASIGCAILLLKIGKCQPFFIMLASMWAIEPTRLLVYVFTSLRIPQVEKLLSEALNLPSYFLIVVLSIIGLIISFFILRKIYKAGELKNFLIGSFLGAPVGMFLWLKVIGPLILP